MCMSNYGRTKGRGKTSLLVRVWANIRPGFGKAPTRTWCDSPPSVTTFCDGNETKPPSTNVTPPSATVSNPPQVRWPTTQPFRLPLLCLNEIASNSASLPVSASTIVTIGPFSACPG